MKRGVLICLIVFIVLCLSCGSVSAMTGAGTQSNPFKLYNQNDLALMSGTSYAMYGGNGRYFELANDIEMSGTFTPIGTSQYKFNGHFDGKGYKITGLKVNTNPAGLFMYITSGAEIKNINFYNVQISGTGDGGTGVLYGHCTQAGTKVIVSYVNVYNSKVTSSADHVGGIAGRAAVTSSNVEFTSCQVIGCIITHSSGRIIGGIVGGGALESSNVEFTSCFVKDCIIVGESTYNVGAIGGFGSSTSSHAIAQSCNVENCYIYSKSRHAGGIFGYGTHSEGATCTITNCNVLKTTIRADTGFAGGIYGSYRISAETPIVSGCSVSDCTIIAPSYCGGVTGGYYNG